MDMDTINRHSHLTEAAAITLGEFLTLVRRNAGVTWISVDGVTRSGTLRHVVNGADDFSFAHQDRDVRDCHVRITMTTGLDIALPMSYAVSLFSRGELCEGIY